MKADHRVSAFVPDNRFLSAVRTGVATHRSRVRRRLTAGLAVVAVLAGGGGWYLNDRLTSVQRVDLGVDPTTPDLLTTGEPFNVLVLGTDGCRTGTRSSDGARDAICAGRTDSAIADTIAVMRVDPSARRINILSLYRDLVSDPMFDPARPAKLSSLGVDGIRSALSAQFGIRTDHVVSVSMTGFEELAALLDVRLRAGAPVRDAATGLDLAAGCQAIEPARLLALARARHLQIRSDDGTWTADPTGDVGRVTRQQALVRVLFETFRNSSMSATELATFIDRALGSVVVDDQISNVELIRLAQLLGSSEIGSVGAVPIAIGTADSAIGYLMSVRGPELEETLHGFDGRQVMVVPSMSDPVSGGPPTTEPPVWMGPGWADFSAC
jgi:anionic cell wall polymer biosynthesis LytR-Cps2A-Psr (LCP) family protein